MGLPSPAQRTAAGLAASLLGTACVLSLVLAMNAIDRRPEAPPEQRAAVFDVPHKRPAPKPRKPRPKRPPPKAAKRPPPPIPTLSSAVGGLDLGLFGADAVDLSEGANALLGDAGDVVMTADAVDSLPTPTSRSGAPYPPTARAQGITGHVTLSLSFDARGALTDATVADADPTGVFDAAALQTIRMWQFAPATYQGGPVPVSGVELTIDFDLDR